MSTVGKVSLGATTLTIIGCGGFLAGGGSTTGNLATKTYTGTIDLPANSLSDLKLVGPLGSWPISGSGFQLTGFQDLSSLVSIIDPSSGKTVLIGMLDSGASSHTLDAANCAATLLFLALGGSQYQGDERQTFWNAVLTSSTLPALTSVVVSRLTANIFALEDGDSQIVAALDSAAKGAGIPAVAFRSQSTSTGKMQPKTSATDQTIGFDNFNENGLYVHNIDHHLLHIESVCRREALVHYILYSGTSQSGSHHDTPMTMTGSPFELQAHQVINHFPVVRYQDDTFDTFHLLQITPVFDAAEPAFFADSKYSDRVGGWRSDLAKLYRRAAVGLASKVMLEAVGMAGVTFDKEKLEEAAANLNAIGGTTGGIVTDSLQGKNLSTAIKGIAGEARSGDQAALDHLAAIATLVQDSNPVLYYDLLHRTYKSDQLAAFRGALRVISIVGALALSLEFGAEYQDLTTGASGTKLEFAAFVDDIQLSPSGGYYDAGQAMLFTVTVADNSQGPFSYHWELGAVSHSGMYDSDGHSGFSFDSDQNKVTVYTATNSQGLMVVSVDVYRGTGADKVLYASQSATLRRRGAVDMFVGRYYHPNDPTMYFHSMAVLKKDKSSQGTNRYKGGKLRLDAETDSFTDPGYNTIVAMEFDIPAFTGLPLPETTDPRLATRIYPSFSDYTNGGFDCWDLGDRIVLTNASGGYAETDSQTVKDFQEHFINEHCNATTATAVWKTVVE